MTSNKCLRKVKPKLVKLAYTKTKSHYEIVDRLLEALKYARANEITSIAIIMVTPRKNISKRKSISYAVKTDIPSIEALAKEMENGYELLQKELDILYGSF